MKSDRPLFLGAVTSMQHLSISDDDQFFVLT